MKRYSILVIENSEERELCQVENNPQVLVDALARKTKTIEVGIIKPKKRTVCKYQTVRFIENGDLNEKT